MLQHHYISNHRDVEALNFTGKDFFEKYNINWKKGIEITSVNDVEQTLSLSNGETLAYDKLMICSGASAFIPPVEGLRTSNNVVGLRNLEDAVLIKEQAAKVKQVQQKCCSAWSWTCRYRCLKWTFRFRC